MFEATSLAYGRTLTGVSGFSGSEELQPGATNRADEQKTRTTAEVRSFLPTLLDCQSALKQGCPLLFVVNSIVVIARLYAFELSLDCK
jgi:hypothetical protein